MEKIKTIFSISYSSGNHIEVVALFDTIEMYDETIQKIEDFMDSPQSFGFTSIRLTPFNEDINGDELGTDILISMEDILCVKTSCQVIKYEEPKI